MVRQAHGGRTRGGCDSKIGRKLAALAGAAGAAVTGQEATAITLTQTANVVAAQGITGFSYNPATNTATLGAIRPPSTNNTSTSWDIDGDSTVDFQFKKVFFSSDSAVSVSAVLQPVSPAGFMGAVVASAVNVLNLATNAAIGNAAAFFASSRNVTSNGVKALGNWTNNTPGYFGFKFGSGANTRYGWAQMTVTPGSPANGQGFVIQQAYYKNDGTSISVGAVPVPEPSSMALLAIGSAGLVAWRRRRRDRSAALTRPPDAPASAGSTARTPGPASGRT